MLLQAPDIDFLRGLVAKQSGNMVSQRQAYMLEKQLAPIAESVGLKDVHSLVEELRRTPNHSLSTQVAEAVTVNETSFFRDVHPFEALHKKIIPDLIEQNKARKEIRIWCAASSSGQEPFSLAMTIQEHFPQLKDWKIQIVATDISEKMLAKCKSGCYSQLEVNRGLPVRKLVQFFDRQGSNWQAKPELQAMIRFQRLNLTEAWPLIGKFDIVFVRNVLIYFDKPTKSDVLTRIRNVLTPNGYLFIGSAETTIGLGVPYQREEIDDTVCYRPSQR